MTKSETVEILGADLAAIIGLNIAVEFLANGGLLKPGHIMQAVGDAITDTISDYAATGLIDDAQTEAHIIASAAHYLSASNEEVPL